MVQNPLHGVERALANRTLVKKVRNPLHGVESYPSGQGGGCACNKGIHYMELKGSSLYGLARQVYLALNPLHGVERLCRALRLVARDGVIRIHYMELKATRA